VNSNIKQRLLTPKSNINIGTWNVRTLEQKGRAELFMREIQRYKWDIIGLAETHWTGCGTKCISGYDIIHSGNDNKHHEGVAILMSQNARQTMIAVKNISIRLIYARFRGLGFNLSVIQVYAPTADSSENDIVR
jgi:exonuclease III